MLPLDLLNQLARKDNARAEDSLDAIYLIGERVPRDPATAETWFTRSAKQGDAHSQYALGVLNSIQSGHEHHLSKAADFLRRGRILRIVVRRSPANSRMGSCGLPIDDLRNTAIPTSTSIATVSPLPRTPSFSPVPPAWSERHP